MLASKLLEELLDLDEELILEDELDDLLELLEELDEDELLEDELLEDELDDLLDLLDLLEELDEELILEDELDDLLELDEDEDLLEEELLDLEEELILEDELDDLLEDEDILELERLLEDLLDLEEDELLGEEGKLIDWLELLDSLSGEIEGSSEKEESLEESSLGNKSQHSKQVSGVGVTSILQVGSIFPLLSRSKAGLRNWIIFCNLNSLNLFLICRHTSSTLHAMIVTIVVVAQSGFLTQVSGSVGGSSHTPVTWKKNGMHSWISQLNCFEILNFTNCPFSLSAYPIYDIDWESEQLLEMKEIELCLWFLVLISLGV